MTQQIGVVGLAVMGKNLAWNIDKFIQRIL